MQTEKPIPMWDPVSMVDYFLVLNPVPMVDPILRGDPIHDVY